ncbi:hypothetical protein D1AOALGA4SA_4793 [Olavius algarvensis Delta 1 endosymbiont]|nr:hypothetical protein D1AOALGA4SA_4793 [Olavius algarvensis Delta 1 endosymbiont]
MDFRSVATLARRERSRSVSPYLFIKKDRIPENQNPHLQPRHSPLFLDDDGSKI